MILLLLGCMWWAFHTYFILYFGKSLPSILYAGNFIPWVLFFVLGMFFKKNDLLNNIAYKVILGEVVFFLVLSVIESVFVMNKTNGLNGLGQKASAFGLNTFLCILAMHKISISFISRHEYNRFYQVLCLLGRYSFGIYLIHLFFRDAIFRIFIIPLHPSILWFVASMTIIFASLGILVICKKIFPRISRILLGV